MVEEINGTMSKRRTRVEQFEQHEPIEPAGPVACATLDPPESDPPTDAELGLADGDNGDGAGEAKVLKVIAWQVSAPGEKLATQVTTLAENPDALLAPIDDRPSTIHDPPRPAAPDCSLIVTGQDRQAPPAWPESSPFQVDWPWGAIEGDPVPGHIVGWNWQRGEVLVVTAVPPVTRPWPYTLTVEVRPMPESYRYATVYNLATAETVADVEWYTRWNRAYGQTAVVDGKMDMTIGSGWLAVVPAEEGQP